VLELCLPAAGNASRRVAGGDRYLPDSNWVPYNRSLAKPVGQPDVESDVKSDVPPNKQSSAQSLTRSDKSA
jgi:hypothetical protein